MAIRHPFTKSNVLIKRHSRILVNFIEQVFRSSGNIRQPRHLLSSKLSLKGSASGPVLLSRVLVVGVGVSCLGC